MEKGGCEQVFSVTLFYTYKRKNAGHISFYTWMGLNVYSFMKVRGKYKAIYWSLDGRKQLD